MSGELLSAEQVRGLLEGVTPGDWVVGKIKAYAVFPCHPMQPSPQRPRAIATVNHWSGEHHPAEPEDSANVRLIAAAPTLAHTALSALARAEAAEAEVERLREVLERVERRADKGADRNAYGALRAIRLEVRAALARPAAAGAEAEGRGE